MGNILGDYTENNYEQEWSVPEVPAPQPQFINIHGHKYRIIGIIGRGSIGAVFQAVTANGVPVAIKAVDLKQHPNPNRLIESIATEIQMSFSLKKESNHIVQMYDFDFDPRSGFAYLTMELGGDNLDQHLNKRGDMSPTHQQKIWKQLVNILVASKTHNIGFESFESSSRNLSAL
ncbi:unnamed protein product [Didymodactylos carnosus]|uniref:Protein kinase domain-containing protein n=1 Tax=Didymodactylos carnosus TaxID=1234261 RepID=A0A815ACY9_9BILA|nr:unnamed protein product [Didymodactylos carnosus]CAF4026911.1 unnamed protein product [Didymodactylos carnosus]